MSIIISQTLLRKICGHACNFLAAECFVYLLCGDLPGEDRCGFGGTAGIAIVTRVGCDSTGGVTALEDA